MSSRVEAELALWVWGAQEGMVISLHSKPLGQWDTRTALKTSFCLFT